MNETKIPCEETSGADPFPAGMPPDYDPRDYDACDYEVAAFGERWVGPKRFKPSEETLVARYAKYGGGDQSVDVYCSATPARFYKLRVHAGTEGVGDAQPTYEVDTGSSQHKLAADLAQAISKGILSFEVNVSLTGQETGAAVTAEEKFELTKSELSQMIADACSKLSSEDKLDLFDAELLTDDEKQELIARWTAREDLPPEGALL